MKEPGRGEVAQLWLMLLPRPLELNTAATVTGLEPTLIANLATQPEATEFIAQVVVDEEMQLRARHGWLLEQDEKPLETSQREVEEETGIPRASLELLARAPPRLTEKPGQVFEVYSFLYLCTTDQVRLDWENDEFAWVAPEALRDYRTVPWLPEMVSTLMAEQ